jgi:hypothetical protein
MDLMDKDRQQSMVLNQTKIKFDGLTTEIAHREDEINNLRVAVKKREMQCDAALVSDTLGRDQADKMKRELAAKDNRIQELEIKLFET